MQKITTRLYFWHYWYVTRNTRKFVPWVARKLPRRVKYWVVIHGMCKAEPNGDPSGVTGLEMLDLWESPKDKKARTNSEL